MRSSRRVIIGIFFAGVAVLCGMAAFSPGRTPERNIVLITIDALRRDHLGCYGYKRDTSAVIDRLAEKGIVFQNAVASSSHTPAAVASLATGVIPPLHGVRYWGMKKNPRVPTIGQSLKEIGYTTIFVEGNGGFKDGLVGVTDGFDVVIDVVDGKAAALTDTALSLLPRAGRPFFLWLHYMDAHEYSPPEQYRDLFRNDAWYDASKRLPISKAVHGLYGHYSIPLPLARQLSMSNNPDDYVAAYDSALRAVDEQIGRIVDRLAAEGRLADTLIIITADHGELQGEHGYYFHHGSFLYEPLIKVPLVLSCPRLLKKHLSVPDVVSAGRDVPATIRDYAGIAVPPGPIYGTSLLAPNAASSGPVYSEFGAKGMCVLTQTSKLIWKNRDGSYVLYDLANDPFEEHAIATEQGDRTQGLRQAIKDYIAVDLVVPQQPPVAMDENLRQRLQSLGYLQ